jgi:PAS domain S-box-containing protein
MFPEAFSPLSENDAVVLEASLLSELVALTTNTPTPSEWMDATFGALAKLLPYQFAFALVFSDRAPHIVLYKSQVPHTLDTDLETLELSPELVEALDDSNSAIRLESLISELDEMFRKFRYGVPRFVPLTADARVLGVLVMVGDSHPETREAWLQLQARHEKFLGLLGNLLGAALRRARLADESKLSVRRYRTFVEMSPEGFWETDAALTISFVNESAARLMGLRREDLIGKRVDRLVKQTRFLVAEDVAKFEELIATLMTQGSVVNAVLRSTSASGLKQIAITGHVVRDAEGRVVRLQGTLRDITAEVQAREELERRTRDLELLHELSARMNATIDTRAALTASLDMIKALTDAEAIGIWLVDKELGQFHLAAHSGGDDVLAQHYTPALFDYAVYEAGFDADKTRNVFEYLISTRRVLTTQDFLANPQFDISPARQMGYQSHLVFPMHFDQEVYGVVWLGSKQAEQFDAHDTQLGSSLAAQLGLAIHMHHLVAEHERAAMQAQALAQIGRKIQYAPRAEQALHSVVRDIKTILDADYVVIQLLRVDEFEVITATDTRETIRSHPIAPYEQKIFETDMPLRVDDSESPQTDPQQRAILTRLGLRASLSMRLFAHDHPLGILFVNQVTPRHWRADQVEFVRRAAQQIAYALENKRLLDASAQQLRELRALGNAARLIGSPLDPENALQAVAEEIAHVFRVDYVGFHLLENDALLLVAESGESGAPKHMRIYPHQRRVLQELDTVVICDRDAENLPPTQLEFLTRYNFRADIGTPLLVGNKAIGILYLSQRTRRRWTNDEIRLAETFAQQIASALEHTRLLKETRTQVRDLRALARSAQLIATSRSLSDSLPLIAYEFKRVLGADYVGFHLVDGDMLQVVTEPQHPFAGLRYSIAAYHRLVLEQAQRTVVNDATQVRDEAFRANLERFNLKADIGVPLLSRGKPLGILYVSQATPRIWTDSEVQLVETFAQQIASVLDLVKVLKEKEARVRELEMLLDLHELTAMNLDEDSLQDMALRQLQNLLDADTVGLVLVDGDVFKPMRTADGRSFPDKPMPLTPLLRAIFENKEPFVTTIGQLPQLSPQGREYLAFYGAHTNLAAPMVTASGPIGLLNLVFRAERAFTLAEKRLVQAAANQLAMAFANARLLAQQKQRIERSSKLTEFSLFCNSIQDSAALQHEAVRRICDMLGVRAASIRLIQDGCLTTGASFGYANPQTREHSIPIDGRLKEFLDAQRMLAIPDLSQAANLPEHWRQRHLAEGFNAGLMAPMIVGKEVLGLLTVFHGTTYPWRPLETQYVQTIASTLALALSNIKQKEALERKSEELQAIMDSVFSGVLTTDATGVIVTWNRQAEQITGFSAAEMVGKRWDIDGPRVGIARRDDTLILEAMADKQARFGLATRYFTRANGRNITLREVATPLQDRSGNVRGAVCAFWDRTEEQEGERAKVDFINEVAHQVGNKLGAVIMSAQQLQRNDLNEKTRTSFIQVIANSVEDLQDFQKRFIAFQRERAQEAPEETEVRLRDLVRDKIKPLRLRKPPRKFRIGGDFDFVLADPARLGIVLENLLDNAFKYSPPNSTITVWASCPSAHELILKIHNKGNPIPQDVQPHLFERWQRGTYDVPGSGLGLWLVKTKLHEMGADIHFSSNAKEGTTFFVTLRRKVHHLPDTPSDDPTPLAPPSDS